MPPRCEKNLATAELESAILPTLAGYPYAKEHAHIVIVSTQNKFSIFYR